MVKSRKLCVYTQIRALRAETLVYRTALLVLARLRPPGLTPTASTALRITQAIAQRALEEGDQLRRRATASRE